MAHCLCSIHCGTQFVMIGLCMSKNGAISSLQSFYDIVEKSTCRNPVGVRPMLNNYGLSMLNPMAQVPESEVRQANTTLAVWKEVQQTELHGCLYDCVVGEKIFYVAVGHIKIKSCGRPNVPLDHSLEILGPRRGNSMVWVPPLRRPFQALPSFCRWKHRLLYLGPVSCFCFILVG